MPQMLEFPGGRESPSHWGVQGDPHGRRQLLGKEKPFHKQRLDLGLAKKGLDGAEPLGVGIEVCEGTGPMVGVALESPRESEDSGKFPVGAAVVSREV